MKNKIIQHWAFRIIALCLCFLTASFSVLAENDTANEQMPAEFIHTDDSNNTLDTDEDLIIPPCDPENVPLNENAVTTFSHSITRTIYNPGGQNLSDYLGISRQDVIDVLAPHINDSFFLGTPYVSGDHCNPNGDPAGYGVKDAVGVPALNCTGFVWYVLHTAGSDHVPGRNGWVTLLNDNQITYITYVDNTGENREALKEAVAADAEPGDIIWAWEGNASNLKNGLSYKLSSSHHIGIYIGEIFNSQLLPSNPTGQWHCTNHLAWWHSTNASFGENLANPGNFVTEIAPKASNCISYTLIKLNGSLEGKLTLSKTSSLPDISQGNLYSLEGAVYGVYADSDCTQLAGELVTDISGNTNTLILKEGDYWIKETAPPKGFTLNTQIHPVSVKYGETVTCQTEDVPQYTNIDILLQKVDLETNKALSGAEFTVKYYSDFYESDPQEQGTAPDRVWIFQTDEEGLCRLDDTNIDFSDPLFYDKEKAILPLGTITIQETKAPEGYLLSDTILVYPITPELQEFPYPVIENKPIPAEPLPEPEAPAPENPEPEPEKPVQNIVQTGDSSALILYLTLLFLSSGAILYLHFYIKREWSSSV